MPMTCDEDPGIVKLIANSACQRNFNGHKYRTSLCYIRSKYDSNSDDCCLKHTLRCESFHGDVENLGIVVFLRKLVEFSKCAEPTFSSIQAELFLKLGVNMQHSPVIAIGPWF